MKSRILATGVFLLLLASCKSEIDDKTAAGVTETTAATATQTPDTSSTAPAAGATTVNVIREQSSIKFVGAKVTRDHNGEFKDFTGTLDYVGGKPSRIAFEMDLRTLETDTPQLTEHLKSPDFFDVAKLPTANFVSTSLSEAPAGSADGATHIVKGNLTMHGVTREVTIPAKAEITPQGARATSEFTINRHDWGISYRGMADDLIKDLVLIKLDLAFPPPPGA